MLAFFPSLCSLVKTLFCLFLVLGSWCYLEGSERSTEGSERSTERSESTFSYRRVPGYKVFLRLTLLKIIRSELLLLLVSCYHTYLQVQSTVRGLTKKIRRNKIKIRFPLFRHAQNRAWCIVDINNLSVS